MSETTGWSWWRVLTKRGPLEKGMVNHFRKDSDAGRDWGQEEKGTTEDEMAGWHH